MKVTLGQINTIPNDFDGNYKQIEFGIKKAIEDGSDLVVFPELSIPGYNIQDLIYNSGFVNKNYEYLNKVCGLTKDYPNLHVLVGYVDKNNNGSGRPFYNSVAHINNGYIKGKHNKWLLPYTDLFWEGRWYEPGNDLLIVDVNGQKCAVTICEENWADKGQTDYDHHLNPIQKYRELGIQWNISLNASPYIMNKPEKRVKMFEEICGGDFGVIYCNLYGGQDDMVFDGHSFIMNKQGSLVAYLKNPTIPEKNELSNSATGQYQTFDTNFIKFIDTTEEDDMLKMLILGLYDYGTKSGFDKFSVNSSGGVDSACVIALASMAFGGKNVHAIMIPSIYSSEGSVVDAKQLHKNFEVNEYLVPIEHQSKLEYINSHLGLKNYNNVADENFQARLRGQIGMHLSNAINTLMLTTGNKSELCMGYYTSHGGDAAGFIDPIGDLYKKQVFALCRRINEIYKKEMIPNIIINKAPSAELAPNQFDEKSLMPYFILDELCQAYIEDYVNNIEDFYKWLNKNNKSVLEKINNNEEFKNILKLKYYQMIKKIDNNEFKRRVTPFCIKISKKAFGPGRRIPICKVVNN